MTDDQYRRCKYSITCATGDLAVVHCLRALCQHVAVGVLPQIAWGGTKESDWRAAGDKITLRFTSPESRDRFVSEARRLLPQDCWHEVRRRDDDPARRQRARA